MITVLLTTGWIFWGAVGVIILFSLMASISEDEGMGGWATFLVSAGFILTMAFTDVFIGVKLLYLALMVAAYLSFGVLWSFKKWIDFVKWKKEDLKKVYATYSKTGKPPIQSFDEYIKDQRPEANQHMAQLISWASTWPLSFSWWALTYPRHFFVWAYNRMSTVFDRISTKIWENA